MHKELLEKKQALDNILIEIDNLKKQKDKYTKIIVEDLGDEEIIKLSNIKLNDIELKYNSFINERNIIEQEIIQKKVNIGGQIREYLHTITEDIKDYLNNLEKRDQLSRLILDLEDYTKEIKVCYEILAVNSSLPLINQNSSNTVSNNQTLKVIQNPYKTLINSASLPPGYILSPTKQFSNYSLHDSKNCLNHFFKDHLDDIKKVVSCYKNKAEALKYLRDKHGLCPGDNITLNRFISLCSSYKIN